MKASSKQCKDKGEVNLGLKVDIKEDGILSTPKEPKQQPQFVVWDQGGR